MNVVKNPQIVQARQWNTHGDVPEVDCLLHVKGDDFEFEGMGDLPVECFGWLESHDGGEIVIGGDWIITGVNGYMSVCKSSLFESLYVEIKSD